jgi:hypothetical protein
MFWINVFYSKTFWPDQVGSKEEYKKHLIEGNENNPYDIDFKTNNKTMNILFLHGLESKLSDPGAILETGKVLPWPRLQIESNVIQNLYDEYHNQDINVIIGSSMGGFTA